MNLTNRITHYINAAAGNKQWAVKDAVKFLKQYKMPGEAGSRERKRYHQEQMLHHLEEHERVDPSHLKRLHWDAYKHHELAHRMHNSKSLNIAERASSVALEHSMLADRRTKSANILKDQLKKKR